MPSWTFISTVWWVLSQVNHSHPLNIGPNGISMTLWVANRCLNTSSFTLIWSVEKVLLIVYLYFACWVSTSFVVFRYFFASIPCIPPNRMITFLFSFRCVTHSLSGYLSVRFQNQFEIFYNAKLEKNSVKCSTQHSFFFRCSVFCLVLFLSLDFIGSTFSFEIYVCGVCIWSVL